VGRGRAISGRRLESATLAILAGLCGLPVAAAILTGESLEVLSAFRRGAERRIVSRRWQVTNVYS